MYFGEVAADIDGLQRVLGRKATADDVETLTWALGMLGKATWAFSFVKAIRKWGETSRVMSRFCEKYDVYRTPTMAHPPIHVGELKPKPMQKAALGMVNKLGLGKPWFDKRPV